MRKLFLVIISFFVFSSIFSKAQELDSLIFEKYRGLDSLLTQFYSVLEFEDVDEKSSEMDKLIAMVGDSLARQHVALQIFDHYRYSRLMGDEAVAIHIFDEWISSGKIQTRSEFEKMDAELFCNFNRNSLIGMQAPVISLSTCSGRKRIIPEQGRISILFFYDTSCAKCRLEAQVLPQVLAEVDFPMDFNAIYVGSNKKEWRAFRRKLKIANAHIRLRHFWDPELESDYQRLYAVLGTPRLYLIEPEGLIIARRLEMSNLVEMLPVMRAIYETYSSF